MPEKKYIDAISVFNFSIIVILSIIISSINDSLFFKTDIINLFHVFIGINLLLFIMTIIPLLLILKIINKSIKEKILLFISLFILGNILFGFIYKVLIRFLFSTSSLLVLIITACILYIICIIIPFLLPDRKEISKRIIKFSKILNLLFIIFFVLLTSYRYIRKNISYNQKRVSNILMIIMDGLSTKALPFYNPDIKICEFDEIIKKSTLFMNQYTNFTFTSGYFGALYCGCKDRSVYSKNSLSQNRNNLFSILQKNNINTRWSVYHQNAIPETSGIDYYNGLRSFYLNEHLTWFPRLLGMDYNVNRFSGTNKKDPALRKIIQKFLYLRTKNPFETYLIDEIEYLRNDKRPFCLIYHTRYSGEQSSISIKNEKINELWEDDLINKSEINKIKNKIKGNYYEYDNKNEWLANLLRREYERHVEIGIKGLYKFYKIFLKRGWDQDTIIIITADHGQIFSKGKLWYGYHNEEEVTKVPLIIIDNQNKGIIKRLGETIDITQTILDYFGINEIFSANANSLMKNEPKKYVTSLTTKGRNQYLNIYQFKSNYLQKYIINILHEDNISKTKVNNFDTIGIDNGRSVFKKISFDYNDILREYGLK